MCCLRRDCDDAARECHIGDGRPHRGARHVEINFSHTFAIRDRQLFLTAYADKAETLLDKAPVQQIHAAIRRLRKRYSPEMLEQMHVASDGTPEA